MSFSYKSVIRFFIRIVKGTVDFFYCKKDGIQEGVEKLLNCWVYEIIAIVGLFAGFLGIGFGQGSGSSWETAGMLWVGPLAFSFVLNGFLVFNYFGVIKRSTKEEQDIYFPETLSKLLKINAFVGWFLPFGIYAKGMLYKHFWGLYKQEKLPWVSSKDTPKERRRKFKQQRIAKKRALNHAIDMKVWGTSKTIISAKETTKKEAPAKPKVSPEKKEKVEEKKT